MESMEATAQDTTTSRQGPPDIPPSAQLLQMVMGKILTQMIGVAARLRIADMVKERPKPVSELAAAAGVHEQSLYRVLRALASVGVFAETEPRTFTNTPMSEALRSDARESVRDFAIFFSYPEHNRIWNDLLYSVQTGSAASEKAFGMKGFDWLDEYPEFADVFHHAMTSLSRQNASAVVQAYDFSDFEQVVDVGGGHGFLISAILQANPTLHGVLFDLPNVVDGADNLLTQAGVSDRCDTVGGSFFESVAEGADCYIMKSVIHDWNDEASATILRNCRTAMKPGGKVLVVDMVIPPGNAPHPGKMIDIEMLTVTQGGFERTADEFRALYESAGLKLTRILPTMGPMSIVEGEAA